MLLACLHGIHAQAHCHTCRRHGAGYISRRHMHTMLGSLSIAIPHQPFTSICLPSHFLHTYKSSKDTVRGMALCGQLSILQDRH